MNHYDDETIEESSIELLYNAWMNLRLSKVHIGANKTYITKYAAFILRSKEEGSPVDETAARDIFLSHINHEAYDNVVMDCRINKYSLIECYDRIGRVGVAVEKNAAKSSRRLNNTNANSGNRIMVVAIMLS